MKKYFFTQILLVLTYLVCVSQNETSISHKVYINKYEQKVEVISPSSFTISMRLNDLMKRDDNKRVQPIEAADGFRLENNLRHPKKVNKGSSQNNEDPILQKTQGSRILNAPIVNFDGLTSSIRPLDPSGAASANYYVQAINNRYGVYDKNGNVLLSSTDLRDLWPGLTSDRISDPIVLYDKHADRWFVSIFTRNSSFTSFKLLIAVSQTNDPTGSYYTYAYSVDFFPDFPKYSIWWDGYYLSFNSFLNTTGVLEREKMLVGDPSAQLIILGAPMFAVRDFISILPADADGSLPPNGSPCYLFNLADDTFANLDDDQDGDAIEVFKMVTDWVVPSNTSITKDGLIPTSAFDTHFSSLGFDHISQKNVTAKLDAIPEILYYRAQHRVWAGYNSVVLSHVVDVNGANRAGMRWYELRQVGTGGWTLYQEGTYAPTTDTDNRWMGSIAMDDQGNIGMGYSVSGPNTYPSIRYVGRMASDPLGEMTTVEQIAIEGGGSQTGSNRYGDYSHLSLDPDGLTFWHTAMYLDVGGRGRTRVYSFRLDGTTAIDDNPYYKDLETTIINTTMKLDIEVKGLKDNSRLTLDIFDISGKLINHFDINPEDNQFKKVINTSSYSNGTYLIRYGNLDFQKVEKIAIFNN